jgi:DNA-binding GntR family transcriptional regulator
MKTKMIKHSNLSQRIYEILKNQIINEELASGERLLDDKLASSFGVSRTPVREALTRLASEDLVEITPRSGIYVKKLTKKDVEEIYEIRKVLEGLAVREATSVIDGKKLEQLNLLLQKAERSLNGDDCQSCIDFDVVLHNSILKNCQNSRLYSIITNLNTLIHVFRVRIARNKEKAKQALSEHEAILNAIKARNPEKAEKAMMEHIEKSKEYIFANFGFLK